jgi:beta-lactamase class A
MIVAHKTGTMPGVRNDVAILTSADGKHHIAIAILTKGVTSTIDDAAIAAVARIVYEAFRPLT